ncbi:MAG TPA: hypothetical protein VGM82_23315 [Gemmatimonadaceae bacterium]
MAPLHVDHVSSSFFENRDQFPMGAATFDCALVMRAVVHSWHALPSLLSVTHDAHAAA